jgi:hypothetical protein
MTLNPARLLGFRIAGANGAASAKIADKVGDKPTGTMPLEKSE